MPALSNERHEAYCQGVAMGLSKTDAHEAAGYTRNPQAAATMGQRPDIQERIQELEVEAAEVSAMDKELRAKVMEQLRGEESVTHAWLQMQFMMNCEMARKMGELGHANKALEMIGKIRGMFDFPDVPKKRHPNTENPDERLAHSDPEEADRVPFDNQYPFIVGGNAEDFIEAETVDDGSDDHAFASDVEGPGVSREDGGSGESASEQDSGDDEYQGPGETV